MNVTLLFEKYSDYVLFNLRIFLSREIGVLQRTLKRCQHI